MCEGFDLPAFHVTLLPCVPFAVAGLVTASVRVASDEGFFKSFFFFFFFSSFVGEGTVTEVACPSSPLPVLSTVDDCVVTFGDVQVVTEVACPNSPLPVLNTVDDCVVTFGDVQVTAARVVVVIAFRGLDFDPTGLVAGSVATVLVVRGLAGCTRLPNLAL